MKTLAKLISVSSLILIAGCNNMNPTEQSVLSGSALGTIAGAALGSLSGNAGQGAIMGAGIGGLAGAMQDSNNRRNYSRPDDYECYHEMIVDKDGRRYYSEDVICER